MKKNSKTIAKYFLYVVLAFSIALSIQFMFYEPQPYQSDALNESLNLSTVLTEEEALEKISTEEIINVVNMEDSYLVKTSTGEFYQLPMLKSVSLRLELEGVKPSTLDVEESSEMSLVKTLLTLFFIAFIIKILVNAYLERKMYSNLIGPLPQSADGGFEPGMPSETRKDTKDVGVKTETTFKDVEGIDELKPDLYRLVDCLKNPEKYKELGARMTKGVILYGPPGTGKTLTARAIAGESGVPFFSICGSDFVEKYVGVGASRVRELYKKARKNAPCIVFIDEIDAIGGGRGEANNSEKDQTINALLAELDGFKGSDGVLTICATNRLDILDPALLRAGRFDLKLAVGLPDREGREAILKLHAKNKKLTEDVSIKDLASKTMGFSGAELENLLNEGALIAAANDKKVIDKDDIEDAFFKIIMDGNKKKRTKIDEDTYITAWHEAGHTIVTKLLTNDGVPMVTIIKSTSGAGGVTFTAPDESDYSSKKDLRNQIKVDYAGRAGEEIYLGNSDDITTGASQDIKQATAILKNYIGTFGMGNQGLIDIKQLTSQYDIVEEAGKLSTQLYGEVLELLRENYDKLKNLAEALVKKETLYEAEIDEILGIPHKEEVKEIDISKMSEETDHDEKTDENNESVKAD